MIRFNPKTQKFEPYAPTWDCTIVPDVEDVDERTALSTPREASAKAEVHCAYCGKTIRFGDSWMSHFIQPDDHPDLNHMPSYAVCSDCIKKEMGE